MIYRDYECLECGAFFEVECESNDGDPECPVCNMVLEWRPKSFNITGHKAKAIDYTQKIIEEDFHMSNMNDQSREGDIAYKAPPPIQTSEKDQIEREVREYVASATSGGGDGAAGGGAGLVQQGQAGQSANTFWGQPSSGNIATNSVPAQMMLAGVKTGPQGPNPMTVLQEGIKSGQLSSRARMIARWRP